MYTYTTVFHYIYIWYMHLSVAQKWRFGHYLRLFVVMQCWPGIEFPSWNWSVIAGKKASQSNSCDPGGDRESRMWRWWRVARGWILWVSNFRSARFVCGGVLGLKFQTRLEDSELYTWNEKLIIVDFNFAESFLPTLLLLSDIHILLSCPHAKTLLNRVPPTWWTPLHWKRWTGSCPRHRCHVRRETKTKKKVGLRFGCRVKKLVKKLWSDRKEKQSKTFERNPRFCCNCFSSIFLFWQFFDSIRIQFFRPHPNKCPKCSRESQVHQTPIF